MRVVDRIREVVLGSVLSPGYRGEWYLAGHACNGDWRALPLLTASLEFLEIGRFGRSSVYSCFLDRGNSVVYPVFLAELEEILSKGYFVSRENLPILLEPPFVWTKRGANVALKVLR